MYLSELLKLAAAGPDKVQQAAKLAGRLAAMDKEREEIIAALAELGVLVDAGNPGIPPLIAVPAQLAPNVPLCEVCGKEASEQVDDVWYCGAHGDAAIEQRMKPAAE